MICDVTPVPIPATGDKCKAELCTRDAIDVHATVRVLTSPVNGYLVCRCAQSVHEFQQTDA